MTKQIKIVAVGIVLLMQGQLTQAYGSPSEVPGSWQQSCWAGSLNNNVLTAVCKSPLSQWAGIESSINLTNVKSVKTDRISRLVGVMPDGGVRLSHQWHPVA